jgi:hypothetical protein
MSFPTKIKRTEGNGRLQPNSKKHSLVFIQRGYGLYSTFHQKYTKAWCQLDKIHKDLFPSETKFARRVEHNQELSYQHRFHLKSIKLFTNFYRLILRKLI